MNRQYEPMVRECRAIYHSGFMFKADMILAYLEGLKTKTRRTKGLSLVNENPDDWELIFTPNEAGTRFVSFAHKHKKAFFAHITMPYGGFGDQLYFKETWKMWERDDDGKDFLHYRADDAKVDPEWWTQEEWTRPDPVWAGRFEKWQSSMFMPRICSRFRNVPIMNVRVERLHDITEQDAYDEGCSPYAHMNGKVITSKQWYMGLWDEINGKTLPWSKNPWVWVYEFPRYKKP